MLKLNPLAVSSLVIAFIYIPLFIFIFLKGKDKASKIYSFHILSVVIWGIGGFLIALCHNKEISLILWKITYSGVLLIPVFFYHSVLLMTNRKSKTIIAFIYLQALYFITCMFFDVVLIDIRIILNSYYYLTTTPTYIASVILWILIVSVAHLHLISYYKKSYPEQKKQILALFFAIAGFSGGLTNFLPAFDIYTIYPYGNFLIPIHALIVSYAIFKHQLLGIKIIIQRSIVYSMLIATISLTYLVLVVVFERILQATFGYTSIFISVVVAFFLGILFVPLRTRVQYIVDQILFKRSHLEIAQENELLHAKITEAEKFKAIATLASGVAHEIKNPLTAIKTFSEFLPEKKNDAQFLAKFSKIVGREVTRIDALVHQLLEFAKPSPLKKQWTNIHHLIDDTLDFLNSEFVKRKITISKNYTDPKDKTILIDPQQIKQALLNILINSIDAIVQNGKIEITTHLNSPNFFTIIINDSGIGISKRNLKNIFDPFFSKKDNGTGLGLSITHSIISEHNGIITAESAPKEGSTFIINLPLQTPH